MQTISLNSIHGSTKEIKKIRIHREGTHILWGSFLLLLLINAALYWGIDCKIPFYVVAVASIVVYLLMVNFFRCPIRLFGQDTEKIVVAPADGKIVVIEEVDENEYFHDRRLMVSIFMSIVNVHANWYPVDGTIKKVAHHNGNFMKAWLPKSQHGKRTFDSRYRNSGRSRNTYPPDSRGCGTPHRHLC